MGGTSRTYGERKGAYTALVGKSEGKRPLGKPRRRRKYNIKMDLQEEECGVMDWIDLTPESGLLIRTGGRHL